MTWRIFPNPKAAIQKRRNVALPRPPLKAEGDGAKRRAALIGFAANFRLTQHYGLTRDQ